MDGVVAYILGKSYTKKSLIGIGALAGAPCQVQSINKVGKTTTITLKWEDNVGGIHTQAFDVEDGLDGVSVQNATIKPNGHLELTLSNGNIIDCGKVLPQYDTMPPASLSNEGQILQYIGTTTSSYTNGYFYECINDGGTYKWVEKLVQDSYTKTQIGNLSDLPDNTQNVVQNIGILKLSIDQLQASKLSISDIDNVLSSTSENPVQNKVIKSALDGKEDKFRFSIMPNASDYTDKIVQYIGDTTSSYTKGYYYESREVSAGVYDWVQKNVQPSSGGTGGDGVVDGYYNSTDHLFYEEASYINPIAGDNNTLYVSLDTNLLYRYNGLIFIRVDEATSGEDDVIDGYYKEADGKFYEEPTYTTEIIGETGKIYISDDTNIQYRWDGTQFVTISSSIDVDNVLSTTSENPVQNKVISLKIDQLQGSILEKIQKKLSATADDFVVFTNDGDIADSGISKDVVPSTVSVSNKLLVASDISSKANKVVGATSGDLAELDADGDLVDSGKKLSDLQGKLTDGNGIDIDASNNISLDLTYLTASKVGYIPATEKGSNNGVAELDGAGKVPSSQLPSYVDDVIEGYKDGADFYTDSAHTNLITPESGKIYVDLTTNTTWRWSGTAYVQISESLALGETSSTAYRGDRGKTAYDHSQITDGSNPHNTTANNVNLKVPISALSGSKLDVESTLYGINTELGKKADKVASATNGHLAGLDANGNLTDSGVVADDVIQKVATATGLLKDDGTVDTTEYQPKRLAVPIQTLSGSQLTVETALGGINDDVVKTFTGTQAQWDALSLADKQKYEICNITDDGSTDNVYTVGEVDALLNEKLSYADNGILGAKNLLKVNGTSGEVRGITYTFNSDGTVTLDNGTATGGTSVRNVVNAGDFDDGKFAQELILSGTPASLGSNNYCLMLRDTDNNHIYYNGHEVTDIGNGVTVDFSKLTLQDSTPVNAADVRLVIRVASGVSGGNGVFKPMLRLASDPDNTYQPYAMTNKELTESTRGLTELKTYVTPNIGARFYKIGRVCYVSFESAVTDKAYVDEGVMDTIPEEFRPIYSLSFLDTLGTSHTRIIIYESIVAKGSFSAGQNIRGFVTYITNN